jgi:hypothetical protein
VWRNPSHSLHPARRHPFVLDEKKRRRFEEENAMIHALADVKEDWQRKKSHKTLSDETGGKT